jgi:pantoate--beta-alanine ligase
MRELTAIAEMRAAVGEARREGRRVGLVPTMGYLHAGHLSLVREAHRRAELVVMSVFVNPLQFGPGEDFAKYPRDPERDRALAKGGGVDVLWMPSVEEMYPQSPEVTVQPGAVGTILEGAIRPGHFAGVLTVVLKLFSVVQPDVAVFGRKDAQQAALVRFMIRDLDLPVELVVAPTVRDPDGLAKSSRNTYLDAAMRSRALALPRALEAGVAAFRAGTRAAGQVVAAVNRVLSGPDGLITEYINVVDPDSFTPSHAATERSFLCAAVRVGATRLIDNVVLGEGLEGDPREEERGERREERREKQEARGLGPVVELPSWAVVSLKRVEHIVRVATLIETWARARGVGEAEAGRWRCAAVLHDALRDAGPEVLARYTPQGHWAPGLWHGPAAAAAARQNGEADAGVLDAVTYHSVGYAHWDDVGRMLYLADWLEPGRENERALLDALAARVPADPLGVLREVAARRIGYMMARRRAIPRESWEFWNSLAAAGSSSPA